MKPREKIQVHSKAIKKLRNFYPFLYSDEINRIEGSPKAGDLIEIIAPDGEKMGLGFYNSAAHIRVRVISTRSDEKLDRAFFQSRIRQAIQRRQFLPMKSSRRLIHAEADLLPGLVVDQYNEYLVVQIRSAGMEKFRDLIVSLLRELLTPEGILERSDMESRTEEGLAPRKELLWGIVPDRIKIDQQGLSFWVDPYHGRKTGFYLDQWQTQRQLVEWIRPGEQILEAFQYTGRLGIAAAKAGARVLGIEREEDFVNMGKENAKLNSVQDKVEFATGDAFYLLEAKANQHQTFDWVIIDPPSLAKTRGETQK